MALNVPGISLFNPQALDKKLLLQIHSCCIYVCV